MTENTKHVARVFGDYCPVVGIIALYRGECNGGLLEGTKKGMREGIRKGGDKTRTKTRRRNGKENKREYHLDYGRDIAGIIADGDTEDKIEKE
jgi:hypothetical protein